MNPSDEQDFERWYREEHLHLLSKLPGYRRSTRWKIGPRTPLTQGETQPYLAIHEVSQSGVSRPGCRFAHYASRSIAFRRSVAKKQRWPTRHQIRSSISRSRIHSLLELSGGSVLRDTDSVAYDCLLSKKMIVCIEARRNVETGIYSRRSEFA